MREGGIAAGMIMTRRLPSDPGVPFRLLSKLELGLACEQPRDHTGRQTDLHAWNQRERR